MMTPNSMSHFIFWKSFSFVSNCWVINVPQKHLICRLHMPATKTWPIARISGNFKKTCSCKIFQASDIDRFWYALKIFCPLNVASMRIAVIGVLLYRSEYVIIKIKSEGEGHDRMQIPAPEFCWLTAKTGTVFCNSNGKLLKNMLKNMLIRKTFILQKLRVNENMEVNIKLVLVELRKYLSPLCELYVAE